MSTAFVYTPSEGKTLAGVVSTLQSQISRLPLAMQEIVKEDLLLQTVMTQPFNFPDCSKDRRELALLVLRRESAKRVWQLCAEADDLASKVTAIEQHIEQHTK